MPALWANIVATAAGTVPSYELNRKWAWGKTGKSHLWREVMPFWVLAFIGLAVSTWWAVMAESLAQSHHFSHSTQTAVVELAVISAFGVLWIAKYAVINKVLFRAPAGRTRAGVRRGIRGVAVTPGRSSWRQGQPIAAGAGG
jgi:putative flippase GtrA